MDRAQRQVLLIEADESARARMRPPLSRLEAVCLTWVDSLRGALQRLERGSVDLAVLDLALPDSEGISTFSKLHERYPALPVVVLAPRGQEREALRVLELGAGGCLTWDRVGDDLERTVREGLELARHRALWGGGDQNASDLRIAREIQFELFPHVPMLVPGLDIAGMSYPAEAVGGDYFDFLAMTENHLGLVVADAAGHGLGPALLMAQTRACLNTLAMLSHCPARILTYANAVLADGMLDTRFITACFVSLDMTDRRFSYASAGHPDVFILDAEGRCRRRLPSTDLPMGLHANTQFHRSLPLLLQNGDMLVMLTDGFADAVASSGEVIGVERLLEVVRQHCRQPAKAIIERLYDAAIEHQCGQRQRDDMTAVVVKVE